MGADVHFLTSCPTHLPPPLHTPIYDFLFTSVILDDSFCYKNVKNERETDIGKEEGREGGTASPSSFWGQYFFIIPPPTEVSEYLVTDNK